MFTCHGLWVSLVIRKPNLCMYIQTFVLAINLWLLEDFCWALHDILFPLSKEVFKDLYEVADSFLVSSEIVSGREEKKKEEQTNR